MRDEVSPHQRAVELAVSALDFDLEPGDREWLDEHLERCSSCRRSAERYVFDAQAMDRLPLVSAPARVEARVLGAERDRPAGRSGAVRLLATVTTAALVAAVGGFALLGSASDRGGAGSSIAPSATAESGHPSGTAAATRSPSTSNPSAEPASTATPQPTAVAPIRWERADVPSDATAREIRTIAVRDDRAVATLLGAAGEPRLWWSDAGGPWRDAELPGGTFGGAPPWLVHPWRNGFVALGWRDVEQSPVERRVWLSPDGLAWRPNVDTTATLGPLTYGLLAASRSTVLVAGRSQEGETRVWRSADGVSWTELSVGDDVRGAGFEGLASDGSSFVALVSNGDSRAIWRSDDGEAWTPLAPPSDALRIDGVSATTGTVVVYGASSSEDRTSAAWWSTGHDTWQRAAFGAMPAAGDDAIAAITGSPAGLLASWRLADGSTLLAESADGRTWTLREGGGLPAGTELDKVARAASVLVALDRDRDGRVVAYAARLDD